jgi:cytochrome c-type biogenesis protein CcmH/NrfF
MKNYYTVLLILVSCSFLISAADAQEQELTTDLSLESNLNQLMTSVYCYCGCVRETITNCVCGNAQQIEMDFRNRLINGGTIQQIRADYLARHGTQFSALMPAKGFNIVAYAMPAVIIGLLGVIVFLVLKSKRSAALTQSSVATEPQQPASADQYEQIEEELKRYKQQR